MNKTSLRKNAIANSLSQIYLLAIGIIITPYYWKYLGDEAFGLVGFFTLLLTWLGVLDVGLSPTLGREVAHARGLNNGFKDFIKLLKSYEIIFMIISILIVILISISSNLIAVGWIKSNELTLSTTSYCISLMGFIIALRLFSGLYKSGIYGLEDQIWLNIINIIFTSFKFSAALILLIFITDDVKHFFELQVFLGALELMLFLSYFYARLPSSAGQKIPILAFHFNSVKAVAPFSLGIAYTTAIWILISQVDKLILSGILSLAEFGYLTLIIMISSAINSLSGPISLAVQPRMTFLLSKGKTFEMLVLYRNATQIVTLIVMSIAFVVGFFSRPLIYVWTGDINLADWAEYILFWYSLGNGVLGILAFQYYLQIAHGKLKLHVQGSTLSALLDVPVIFFACMKYGVLGAGIAWFILRVAWLFFWTPIVHYQFAPKIHWKWLLNDVLLIAITVGLITYCLKQYIFIDFNTNRAVLMFELVGIGLAILCIGSVSSSYIRNQICIFIRKKHG